jgi:hypothetical protein
MFGAPAICLKFHNLHQSQMEITAAPVFQLRTAAHLSTPLAGRRQQGRREQGRFDERRNGRDHHG